MIEVLLPGLLAGFILTGIHAYFGYHILRREVIFVDLALAQSVALGYAVAQLLGIEFKELVGFLVALGTSITLTILRSLEEEVSMEALIGVIYVSASALTLILLSYSPHGTEAIREMFEGSLLFTSWRELLTSGALYAIIGAFHLLFLREFLQLIERGNPFWEFLFFSSFALVVSSSVKLAGVFLVFSYLIMPALTIYVHTRELRRVLIGAWVLGVVATSLGMLFSYYLDLPLGPVIILLMALSVKVSVLYKMWRMRRGFEESGRGGGFIE